MTAIFVTATGTDIGKTFVTAGLIRHLRAAGKPVDALKPVVSGFDPTAPEGSDPGALLAALGQPLTGENIARISPFRFAAPLSPDLAARRENRSLDFAALVQFCKNAIASTSSTLFIEGVGGVMVPLDERHTVLDWMAALRLPVLLVTGSYLGTISHTLTALDVLRRREVEVRALVVNETAGATVALADTADSIGRFAGSIPLVTMPRLAPNAGHPAFGQIAKLL
jgi:dethiobiotin synthetase